MARRSSGCLGLLIVVAGVLAIFGWGIERAARIPWIPVLVITGVVVAVWMGVKAALRRARRQNLAARYGSEDTARRIMARMVWHGQTAPQLVDSIGRPVEIDQKVLKTKKKEIWKYLPSGKDRYRLRVTLENDAVIGWEGSMT